MAKSFLSGCRQSSKPTTIYGLLDPLSKELRYIGKTVLDPRKRVSTHVWKSRSAGSHSYTASWLKSLTAASLEPELVVVEVVPAGKDWVDAEQFWIAYFRSLGARLCNHSIGGESGLGVKQDPAIVARRAAKLSGKGHYNFGRKMPDHIRVALEEGKRKMLADPDRRRKAAEASRAAMTTEGRARSIKALKSAMDDPEKRRLRAEKAVQTSRMPDARERVAKQAIALWAARRDEIIAAQNAGKGDDFRRRHSALAKQRWSDPEGKMVAAMRKRRVLSDANRAEIIASVSDRIPQSQIAARFSISQSMVSRIGSGKRY